MYSSELTNCSHSSLILNCPCFILFLLSLYTNWHSTNNTHLILLPQNIANTVLLHCLQKIKLPILYWNWYAESICLGRRQRIRFCMSRATWFYTSESDLKGFRNRYQNNKLDAFKTVLLVCWESKCTLKWNMFGGFFS